MGSFVHRRHVISDVSQHSTEFWRNRQGESEIALFSGPPLSAFLELDPNITAPNVTRLTTPSLTSVLGDVELVFGNVFNRLASASLRDSDDSRRAVRLEEDIRVVLKNVSRWRLSTQSRIADRVVVDDDSGMQ
jgi:hypothetical protein